MEGKQMTVEHNEDKYARQLEIEQQMFDDGMVAHQRELLEARDHGRLADTSPGRALISRHMEPVVKAIEEEIARAGDPGRNAVALKYMGLFDPEVLAYIALRSAINNFAQSVKLTAMAYYIGKQLEMEVRFRQFNMQNTALYKTIIRDLRSRTRSDAHARRVVVTQMNKANIQWDPWPRRDMIHLGLKLIDLIMVNSQLIERQDEKVGRRTYAYVRPTQLLVDLISKAGTSDRWFMPVFTPMIVPPRDWTGVRAGGYMTPGLQGNTLVKTPNEAYLDELDARDMNGVLDGLNALQSTPWRINARLLDVVRGAWEVGLDIGDLATREPRELPPRIGFDVETSTKDMSGEEFEAFALWKRAATTVYQRNARNKSRSISLVKKLVMAEKLRDEPELYFPHNLDWRGRAYPLPAFMNPQADDVGKALLLFADGKPLGEQGACWLAVHLANLWGEDKVDLQSRIDWALANSDDIVRSAADPLGFRWWAEADEPWQFLAACFEWAGYCAEGAGYVSHLPVAVDGTCNGLQNFAAMLRDEPGGSAVNLLPSAQPQDIYQRVADNVVSKLTHMRDDTASKWLELGVTRKVVKRPVMTLPYGATRFGFRAMLMDDTLVPARLEMGDAFPFQYPMQAAMMLGDLIWDAIGEEIAAAPKAMAWLQEVARIAASSGQPVYWTSPSGLLVLQDYKRTRTISLSSMVGNSRVRLTYREFMRTIDKRKQASGIAPNFVHSCDAAHMLSTVLMFFTAVLDKGDTPSFSAVHDSFATHACDVELLGVCLREAFIQQYSNDVLAQFRDEIMAQLPEQERGKVPPLPEKGGLDLGRVRDAAFFFA